MSNALGSLGMASGLRSWRSAPTVGGIVTALSILVTCFFARGIPQADLYAGALSNVSLMCACVGSISAGFDSKIGHIQASYAMLGRIRTIRIRLLGSFIGAGFSVSLSCLVIITYSLATSFHRVSLGDVIELLALGTLIGFLSWLFGEFVVAFTKLGLMAPFVVGSVYVAGFYLGQGSLVLSALLPPGSFTSIWSIATSTLLPTSYELLSFLVCILVMAAFVLVHLFRSA